MAVSRGQPAPPQRGTGWERRQWMLQNTDLDLDTSAQAGCEIKTKPLTEQEKAMHTRQRRWQTAALRPQTHSKPAAMARRVCLHAVAPITH